MDLRANAIITAIDRFSGPVQRMAGALNTFVGRSHAVANAGRRMGSAMSGPGSLGAALGSFAFLAKQLEVEQALNRAQAIFDMSNKADFKPLRDKIMDVAERYPAMRAEIAKGVVEMAQAGMEFNTVIATVEKAVQGAMASGESIKIVAEGVTDVVLGMALPFKTAAEQAQSFQMVNDLLAAAATSANDTYIGFLESMRRAGPVARMVGTDIRTLAAAHAVLADAGIKAERGGIALRTLQVRALAPTKKAREMMRAQNVDWTKWARTDGNARLSRDGLMRLLSESGIDATALGGVAGEIDRLLGDDVLRSNLGVMGDKLTDVIADALKIDPAQVEDRMNVGDAIRRYLAQTAASLDIRALFKELAEKKVNVSLLKELLSLYHVEKAAVLVDAFHRNIFDNKYAKITKKEPGAVERMSGIMMQDFVGAFYRLASAFDKFLDTLASSGVLDTVSNAFEKLKDAISALGRTSPTLLKWGTLAVLTIGVLGPLGILVGGAATAIGALAAGFGLLAPLLASPIAVPLLAIGSAALLLKDGFDPWVVTAFAGAMGLLALAVSPLTVSIMILGATALLLMAKWEPVKQFFADTWDSIKSGFQSLLDWMSDGIDRLFGLFERLRAAGGAVWEGRFSEAWDILKGGATRGPNNDRMEPLARTGDELLRSLTGGTGRLEVQGAATITNRVVVEFVNGVPTVREAPTSNAQVPLRTGTSLGDIGAP